MTYPDDMDATMIPLCDALNSIPGIRTEHCCEGHGETIGGGFYVSMTCTSLEHIKLLRNVFPLYSRWRWDISILHVTPVGIVIGVYSRPLGWQVSDQLRYAEIDAIIQRIREAYPELSKEAK